MIRETMLLITKIYESKELKTLGNVHPSYTLMFGILAVWYQFYGCRLFNKIGLFPEIYESWYIFNCLDFGRQP